VQAVCAKYELPYTTGPLARQYLLALRTIAKLALPDRFLAASSDDAPETASEEKFRGVVKRPGRAGVGNSGARRRGLATAIRNRNNRLNRRQISAPTSRCECSITAPVSQALSSRGKSTS
jgi:NADPH-dependent stearoyl-CoA 9-desaturase